MQKKLLISFLLCCVVFPAFFSGCNNSLTEVVNASISEVRYNLFETKSDEVVVRFTSGFREEPYVLDGVSNNKKEFGVIMVKFLINTSNFQGAPSFVITINEMDFDGSFELNPFDQTYVQDIETFVLDDASISIKILWNNFNFESSLVCTSNSFNINHKDALNLFINTFKTQIKKLIKNHVLQGEVYVKIINDPSLEIDKNYWYVGLIGKTGENYSIVIDPFSKQILAKNESSNSLIL